MLGVWEERPLLPAVRWLTGMALSYSTLSNSFAEWCQWKWQSKDLWISVRTVSDLCSTCSTCILHPSSAVALTTSSQHSQCSLAAARGNKTKLEIFQSLIPKGLSLLYCPSLSRKYYRPRISLMNTNAKIIKNPIKLNLTQKSIHHDQTASITGIQDSFIIQK